jgi:protein subunit release factor A
MTNTQLYTTDKEQLYKDTDVRVIDQRIGMGIGGLNTVIRLYHKPTGILIEMPKLLSSDYHNKMLAFEMLEYALLSAGKGDK